MIAFPPRFHQIAIAIVMLAISAPPRLGGQHPTAYLAGLNDEGGTSTDLQSSHKLDWNGLQFANQSGSSELRIHGYFQADGRLFGTDMKNCSRAVLLFRRVRPLVEGVLANRLEFRFMPDFGEGKSVIQEVFVDYAFGPAATLEVGKFKTPIGLEVLRADRDMTFVERSTASGLAPVRDLGVQLAGSLQDSSIHYALGFFSGTEDGSNANFEWTGSKEGVARVLYEPFAGKHDAPRPLGVGIAASSGFNHGSPPKFSSIGQETFFRYSSSSLVDGQHRRWAPQATYFSGPLGLMAEYILSGETLSANKNRRYISNRGWNIAASIMLTGDRNKFEGFRPAHPFVPGDGGRHWGAWELALRHSDVVMDEIAFPNFADPKSSAKGARESAVGLNWLLNTHAKWVCNYEYTTFQKVRNTNPNLHTERVVMAELQLSL
ncbi:MAG TPA: porin [Edaphobacter sp.]|uniref:OprO/OprP family phosphate-selective porin n=1 Tax=Edaphobacter sp. TaxID=1934404 RepID=UPI002BDF51A0|nr:porin [Edaphobacter sp.]HUZ94127.1 porin [Edaphobacter sp.]